MLKINLSFKFLTYCLSVILSLFLIVSYIFSWTPIWSLMELSTNNPFINVYFLYLLVCVFSIIYFIKYFKRDKVESAIPLVINLIIIILVIIVPFRRIGLNLDIERNLKARERVVEKIQKGQYLLTKNKKIILPFKYKYLSKGGGEVLVEKGNGVLKVLFFTFRGVLDNFSGLIYVSNGIPPSNGIFGADIKELKKINDQWYWIVSW